MIIKNIEIENLRCHRQRFFEFDNSINIIYGANGIGKTTILEAISIASISKSFLPVTDSLLVRNGADSYKISLNAINYLNLDYSLLIEYSLGGRKLITNNYGEKLSPNQIIGLMPIVVLSPDFKNITYGAPIHRRSFIDSILCQTSKVYLDTLIKYKKCLKNRNNLLAFLKKNQYLDNNEFQEWTNLQIELATDIIWRRINFTNEFLHYFIKEYQKIAENKEQISAEYYPFAFENYKVLSNKNDIKQKLIEISKKFEKLEKTRFQTLFGPHKDDLKIYINGGLAKDYASQGQHKTLLIALKLAEYSFLLKNNSERPIILFDDIFSELDEERSQKVLELIDFNQTQVFITMTNPDFFKSHIKNKDYKLININ